MTAASVSKPLLCIVGPTASGKSGLGVHLAEQLAPQYRLEFISMDSAQIYRGMDIGTAKPTAAIQAKFPHHLIDIRDPSQRYSAAEFAHDASQCITQIHEREHVPVLLGGTFLYMRALLEGLHDMPSADEQWRRDLEVQAASLGWPALHQRLEQCDPQAAEKIHPNDAQRIQRALEVVECGGTTRSAAWQHERQPLWAGPVLKLALLPEDRASLRQDIADRFAQMLEEGLLAEVRALHQRGDLQADLPAIRSVGYRQLWQHLDGELSLPAAVEKAVIATRQYAKRQMTWLRSESGLQVLPQNRDAQRVAALAAARQFLAQVPA